MNMMLKSKRLKPNMVDRHIAYIQQEQQKNLARLALYPELVGICRIMVRVLDNYVQDAPQGELALMKLVLAKVEALEKEAQS